MKRMNVLLASAILFITCNNNNAADKIPSSGQIIQSPNAGNRVQHFKGTLVGGFKGDSIFFDVNGSKLQNLTFKGYWRCSGKLEMMPAAGPAGSFTLVNGKVDDHISEPPNGGATAWRFDLKATVEGSKASGTFRMNINGLGCNTGMLKWEAVAR